MRSFLDSEALFVDEDGMIAERGNVLRVETAISPKGSAITLTDCVVHHAEDLAVTSFVRDQAVPYGERALTLKSLAGAASPRPPTGRVAGYLKRQDERDLLYTKG